MRPSKRFKKNKLNPKKSGELKAKEKNSKKENSSTNTEAKAQESKEQQLVGTLPAFPADPFGTEAGTSKKIDVTFKWFVWIFKYMFA